jgi:hypothetical protein
LDAYLLRRVVFIAKAFFVPDGKPPATPEIELISTKPPFEPVLLIDDDVELIAVLAEGPVERTGLKLLVGHRARTSV